MYHPYANLIGLKIEEQEDNYSKCIIEANEKLLNPHGVIHGAVIYALADTGMGAALYPSLKEGEICATVEIKINYFRVVKSGTISCITKIVNRGKRIVNMDSEIFHEGQLVAKANGTYMVFRKAIK